MNTMFLKEVYKNSLVHKVVAAILCISLLAVLFPQFGNAAYGTTVKYNSGFTHQWNLPVGNQKIASFQLQSTSAEEKLFYFTLRFSNSAYWNFNGGIAVQANGISQPITIGASGDDMKIEFPNGYYLPPQSLVTFDVYANVTKNNGTFSSMLVQNGMYMATMGVSGITDLYYPLTANIQLQTIGVGTENTLFPSAPNAYLSFDKYFLTVPDLKADYTNRSLYWTDTTKEAVAYKILYYTGETNFYDRVIADTDWVSYNGSGVANKIITQNRISDFKLGDFSTNNYSLALLLKQKSGHITRSGVISTNNPSSGVTTPISNLASLENQQAFTWTTPVKDITDYKLQFFTNEVISKEEFQRRIDNRASHGEIRFGAAWTDNAYVRSQTPSYDANAFSAVEFHTPALKDTTYALVYVGRTGQESRISNVIVPNKPPVPAQAQPIVVSPEAQNANKLFEQYPVWEMGGIRVNDRDLRWTHNGDYNIVGYKILFYTGETSFYNKRIDDNAWVPYEKNGIANKVVQDGKWLSEFNVGDMTKVNHTLALLFKTSNGYIGRSSVFSSANPGAYPLLSVNNLTNVDNAKLTWTTPVAEIADYKLQFFTNEILSQAEFQRRIDARAPHGEYPFGPVTKDSVIKNFQLPYTQNTQAFVEVNQNLLQPNTTYAILYTARNGARGPVSNTVVGLAPTQVQNVTIATPTVMNQQQTAIATPTFQDVPTNSWYAQYITDLYQKNIMTGDQGRATFRPTDPVVRAEAAKIFLKAKNVDPVSTAESFFCDVKSGDWFFSYVNTLYLRNWSEGYLGGDCSINRSFRPAQALTRAEAVKMLLAINNIQVQGVTAQQLQMFSDVKATDWFAPYVVKAYELGLIKGYDDGRFGAYETINRAEIAKIVKITMDKL